MTTMKNDDPQHSWQLLCMLAERRSGVQRGCDGGSRSADFTDLIDPVSAIRRAHRVRCPSSVGCARSVVSVCHVL